MAGIQCHGTNGNMVNPALDICLVVVVLYVNIVAAPVKKEPMHTAPKTLTTMKMILNDPHDS